jgi:SAM-dependent methyltransferase
VLTPALLDILCCPVCGSLLADRDDGVLRCGSCGGSYPVEAGMPRLLDDRLPGIREKRAEIEGWVKLARAQEWYRPDDEVDAALPFLNRDLGWTDKNWGANEHSFSLLLERYVRPGMRVLEVGAAKCWGAQHLVPLGCGYVGVDILDDPVIGLGRGEFYADRVGPFERVQADGEHLPFRSATFDLAYCVATLHHALDLGSMVRELARVTRPGGFVCALNEGTRAPRASGDNAEQSEERALGINEHVHTLWAYLWSFGRAGLVVHRVEQAEGYAELAQRNIAGKLLRLPGGKAWSMLWAQNVYGYGGVSVYARKPGGRR